MIKLTEGQPATQYTASGCLALSSEEAIKLASNNKKVILCKKFTTPEDSIAIHKCVGIITQVGGLASHASIIARELKKACVINCDIELHKEDVLFRDSNKVCKSGDLVTVDGFTGGVFLR